MRRCRWIPSAACAVLVLAPLGLTAQGASAPLRIWIPGAEELQELELTDGSTLVGRVTGEGDPVRFELMSGATVEVTRSQIVGLRVAEGIVRNGRLWRTDPSSNRLFFGPTGHTIDRSEGYIAVFEVFFPSIGVGLTDRFSIAAGTPLWSGLGSSRPFWVIPKLQVVDQEGLAVSLGALAMADFDDDFGSVGIVFGVVTRGSELSSVTLGAGWGWVDDDLASTPALLLGAEARVGRNVKLITENYWIPTGNARDNVLVSAGPRFLGERLSADLGVGYMFDGGYLVPLVNFVWNW